MTTWTIFTFGLIFLTSLMIDAMPLSDENLASFGRAQQRQRRSYRLKDTAFDSKYGAADEPKYGGNEGRYYDRVDGGPYVKERSFDTLGGGELPLVDIRSFDTLGGGVIPLVERKSAEAPSESKEFIPRMQGRDFDTLGGGEIPWVKRRSLQKTTA